MSREVNEDLIEATIRRVAAAKVAAESEADGPRDDADGSELARDGAPGLHLVPSPNDQPDDPRPAAATARPDVDESRIEATLRRIEAEQSALAAQTGALSPMGAPAADDAESVNTAGAVARIGEGRWDDALQRLRLELEDTKRDLRALAARFEAMLPAAEVATDAQRRPGREPAATAGPQPLSLGDDSWDDTPQLLRIPLGAAPRPAILRDPAPRAATAQRLEASEDEPLPVAEPRAVPSGHAEPKRGFELLPRTYRLTVEDKRRGVDLVPLHRALLGMDGVRDMSLLSYSNGTAIVALETTVELDPDLLARAVSRAMVRDVKVEVHNEQTMVIKLAED